MLPTRHPNPQILHRRDETLERLALRTKQGYIQVNHGTVENGATTLKGLIH